MKKHNTICLEDNAMSHHRQSCTKSYCNNCDTGNNLDIWTCCSPETPCDEFKGDCDSHADCKGNLICGHDNCGNLFEPYTDCCVSVPLGKQKHNFLVNIILLHIVSSFYWILYDISTIRKMKQFFESFF